MFKSTDLVTSHLFFPVDTLNQTYCHSVSDYKTRVFRGRSVENVCFSTRTTRIFTSTILKSWHLKTETTGKENKEIWRGEMMIKDEESICEEEDDIRKLQEKGRRMKKTLPASPSVGRKNTAWLSAVNTENTTSTTNHRPSGTLTHKGTTLSPFCSLFTSTHRDSEASRHD
ncbi:hypothetical protein AMECASPLE_036031 [Ameca splendens]|uniref:Uncharacterized protein n=1 Tax=Ameca splendens TaxID=208324 RepID=A0ABV0YIX6_9TELE